MKNNLLFVLCLISYITLGQKKQPNYVKEGIALNERGEFEKAINVFNDGLSKGPACPDALLNRGLSNVKLGQFQTASQDFDRVLMLDRKNAKAYFYRGREKHRNGDLDGAIEDYNLALKHRLFDDEELFYLMSKAKSQQGNYSDALKDLEYILDQDPFHQPALTQSAYIWNKLKDFKGAEKAASKAIKVDPNCATAYVYRGIARVETGNNSGALEDFDKALSLGELNDQLLFYRGLAKFKLGDTDGAIADLIDSRRKGYLEAVNTLKAIGGLTELEAKSR